MTVFNRTFMALAATSLLLVAAPGCDKKDADKAGAEKKAVPAADKTKPAEAKPTAAKAEAKPAEAKPTAAKAEAKPAEAKAEAKPAAAAAKAVVGQAAPDFKLKDLDGKEHSLSSFKGKTVVIEWYNPDCPFVVAAHNKGILKDMAAKSMAKGVVWLAINSGAPGKQGHGVERNKKSLTEYSLTHPILMDEDGTVGKIYEAKTTPHMYIIGKDGKLAYRGALDTSGRGAVKGEEGYKNYTQLALDEVLAGKPVTISDTKSWGCSVKYGM